MSFRDSDGRAILFMSDTQCSTASSPEIRPTFENDSLQRLQDDQGSSNLNRELDQSPLDWEELRKRSLRPGGFGKERTFIWPQLLGVQRPSSGAVAVDPPEASREEEDVDLDVDEPELSVTDPHPDEHQIKLDTNRSFVLYPVDNADDRDALKTDLHTLLVSLFRKRPKLSYFQGYHDIITVLFLTVPPELQQLCAEKLSLHRVRDSMGSSLEPVLGLVRVTRNLLRLVDKPYAQSLERASPLPFYTLSNLLTLFSHDMPTLPLIQHVFDYLLCRPPIAVIYLATVFILSRKEEVARLEADDEEGMIHSLLSSLPDIVDEVEESLEPAGTIPYLVPDSEFHVPESDQRSEDNSNGNQGSTLNENSTHSISQALDIEMESSSEAEPAGAAEVIDPPITAAEFSAATSDGSPSTPSAQNDSPKAQNILQGEDAPSLASTRRPSIAQSSEGSPERPTKDSFSPATPILSPPHTLPHVPEPQPPPRLQTPPPSEPSRRLKKPKIALSDLLSQADELYRTFPPDHPGLALASIMGPQSVIFTWKESRTYPNTPDDELAEVEDLIDVDEEAEAMLLHPELVVYPFVPEADLDEDGKSKEHRMQEQAGNGKPKRRRRKLLKSRHFDVKTKTIFAGAIIVLGVAMAAYGIRAQRAGSPGLLPGFSAHGQRKWGQGKQWLSGAVVGATLKLAHGLGLGGPSSDGHPEL